MTGRDGEPGFHRGLSPRDAAEAADQEVEHHLAELADRLVEQGMSREEARAEAERRFGSPQGYRTRLERDERRRRTAMRRMEGWTLATAALSGVGRTMKRSPGFALAVVVTLALGIGANATMFGILDRLLFQPPAHIQNPDSVRRVLVERPFLGRTIRGATITFPDYEALKGVESFSDVAAFTRSREYTVGRGAEATRARTALVTANFFGLLGVHPVLGRLYSPTEDQPDVAGTAVVSAAYWERAYGSDPAVLGRTLLLSGEPFTIVGVVPTDFTGVDLAPVDVWIPLVNAGTKLNGNGWRNSTGWYWLSAVARMAPGANLTVAQEQATAAHLARREEEVKANRYSGEAKVELDPLVLAKGPEASSESRVARWLGGVSILVLLIACANVANLFLARGTRRRREVAVRLALGVGRGRLVGMMVVESVVLALMGGLVATLLAVEGGSVVRNALLPGVFFTSSAIGGRVLLFTVATALVAGLLAGVGPALQATRADVTGDLATGAGSGAARRSRTRALLTVAQAAFSVVLLVGAGLFIRSVDQVRGLDLGLDVDRLLTVSLELETTGVFPAVARDDEESSDFDRNAVYYDAMRRIQATPGVTSVTATGSPFQWSFAQDLKVPGLDSLPELPGGGPYYYDVTPGYFSTVGLTLVRGRPFQESDGEGATRVAVVSETMARTVWPDGDALGECLLVGEDATECTTVVGVVEDAARGSIQEDRFMAYYLPLAQAEQPRINALYVRGGGDMEALAASLAPMLRGFDSHVRFASVRSLRDVLRPQSRAWTLGASMFTVFGVLALLVAAIGMYGVLSFDVAQRTRELGIRAALGAERGRLLRSVVASGVGLGAVGIVVGLGIALMAGPWIRDLLFQVSPRDPVVLLGVAGVLLAVAWVASVVPGLRATRVDPTEALRAE